MQIELLMGDLPVDENPGLDSTDPRFDEIATLAQDGEYLPAATASESLIAEGVFDIRLICYFIYGYWLEQRVAGLGVAIQCLDNVIGNNWEAIGPVAKREKSVQTGLSWMLKLMLKTIQYEQEKNTPEWEAWQASVDSDQVGEILDAAESFRRHLAFQLEDTAGPVLDLWSKLEEWLRNLQRLVYRAPEPEPEPEQAEQDADGEAEDAAQAAGKSKGGFAVAGMPVEGSYHMNLLLTKLAAFERLIEEEKFPRAALVADDINQTIANFDPKLYFPAVFGGFVRLQAVNFGELAEYAEHRESPEWLAMQDWFRTDIDSFVNS